MDFILNLPPVGQPPPKDLSQLDVPERDGVGPTAGFVASLYISAAM